MKHPAPVPRPHLQEIPAYVKSRTAEAFGKRPQDMIRLSSNEVTWGPAEAAIAALRRFAARAHLYPDSQCPELLELIANRHHVTPAHVVLGNGSNEVIQFLLHAYGGSADHILVPEPAFSMYRIYAAVAGVKVRSVAATPNQEIDLSQLRRAITARTRLIFLASPNNPTGFLLPRMELELFLMGVSKNILVVIDEAYADFADPALIPDFSQMIRSGKYPNLVILRTFSKSFGLAGLRLGYGLAAKEVIQNCHRVRQPFNVNSLAVEAGRASLTHLTHHKNIVTQVVQGREYLQKKLAEADIAFTPSQANFVMIRVGQAARVTEALGRAGILVRALDSFGLPEHIRVTISKREHLRQFLQSLTAELKKRGTF